MGRDRCRQFPDEIDRLYRLPADGVGPRDPIKRISGAYLIGTADSHTVPGLHRNPVLTGDRERPSARRPDPDHLAGVHPPAGHLANPPPALWCERGEVLWAPFVAGEREFCREDAPDAVVRPYGYGCAPVNAERSCPKVFQVVDVEVAAEVVVRKVRGELQEVLLLTDLVSLLLVRRLSVLLEVRVIPGLKSPPHIDEVRVKDRGSHPCADVAVGRKPALKERHVDDLADQRAGERLKAQHLDLLLDPSSDILCSLLVGPFVAVEDLDQPALLHDLPDDPVPVPVEKVPPRCPDFGEDGDEFPEYGRLRRLAGQPHASAIRSATRSSWNAPPAKRSPDV